MIWNTSQLPAMGQACRQWGAATGSKGYWTISSKRCGAEGEVQARKLAQTRLSMALKLGRLVGIGDREEVAEALSHVPIPELADWCTVHVVDDNRIHKTSQSGEGAPS